MKPLFKPLIFCFTAVLMTATLFSCDKANNPAAVTTSPVPVAAGATITQMWHAEEGAPVDDLLFNDDGTWSMFKDSVITDNGTFSQSEGGNIVLYDENQDMLCNATFVDAATIRVFLNNNQDGYMFTLQSEPIEAEAVSFDFFVDTWYLGGTLQGEKLTISADMTWEALSPSGELQSGTIAQSPQEGIFTLTSLDGDLAFDIYKLDEDTISLTNGDYHYVRSSVIADAP